MKMKPNKYIIATAVASAITATAQAAVVFQVDIHMTGGTSQELQSGWTAWDVDKVTTNNSISTTLSGIGVSITSNGGGYVTARGGTTEDRDGEITGTSWDDVVEDFAVARAGNGSATLSLTGLDNTKTYSLTIYNNDCYEISGNPGFAGGTLTPTITTGAIVGVADAGTITNVREGARTDGDFDNQFISFTPDSGGNADILITSSSNFVLFSGMQLDVVPEPSSAALLGLGGLALIFRRRK
ncbi:MAG: PEP-CTERM sorting domain-containing protein [Akkermansiaceae bacterium]|nr:PEP-CTERM sorting domain-containing protein [Akkermansiaceae bacterium]